MTCRGLLAETCAGDVRLVWLWRQTRPEPLCERCRLVAARGGLAMPQPAQRLAPVRVEPAPPPVVGVVLVGLLTGICCGVGVGLLVSPWAGIIVGVLAASAGTLVAARP